MKLTCVVSAKPAAKMSWKRDLNGNELSSQNDNKVKSISNQFNAIEMTLAAAAVDEEFYCVAVNLLGNDAQKYRIRERGRSVKSTHLFWSYCFQILLIVTSEYPYVTYY